MLSLDNIKVNIQTRFLYVAAMDHFSQGAPRALVLQLLCPGDLLRTSDEGEVTVQMLKMAEMIQEGRK